jgi:hypothetical protein
MSLKPRTLVLLATAISAVMSLVAAEMASATHPRPLAASPITSSLVPTFNECTGTGNRTHGPPLVFPSCNPPVQKSANLTIGTFDANGANSNGKASLRIAVKVGVPGPPEDSDVKLTATSTDIRCKAGNAACGAANAADGADYTGEVQGNAQIRITDHWNAVAPGGGPDAATVQDIPFPVTATCAATAGNTAIGSTCSINTTANAVLPGVPVKDGKRANVEIEQVQITDGGPDGVMGTPAGNTLFAVQGIFIP